MAPYSTVAPPPEKEEVQHTGERPPATQDPKDAAVQGRLWFSDALLDISATRPRHRALDFFLSLFVHTIVLTTLILLPLYFTEAIDLKQFTQTFLVAPPPPPPPPPASPAIVKAMTAPKRVFTPAGRLVAPTTIPEKVAMLKEADLPPELGSGVAGGVPGGQVGGVIGGIIQSAPRSYIPPAPIAMPNAPIRVGGRVKAPRPISAPEPLYPPLARQAKVQGDVVIDAVIDVNGNVVEMQVVSGHPLLIPSALDALRRWRYEPTYLNEQPVPVQLLVTIRFRLG